MGSTKFDFVRCDVARLASHPQMQKQKFDLVNLSNVPNFFVGRIKSKDPMMAFFEGVLLRLRKLLDKKGRIFYYSYSPSVYPNSMATRVPLASSYESINRLKKRKEFKISEIRFKGIGYTQPKKIQYGGFDRITVLEKV